MGTRVEGERNVSEKTVRFRNDWMRFVSYFGNKS
jgi:hypothetical protein